MARQITINGTTYDYPDNGETPGWGSEATDAFEALSNLVGSIVGTNDIVNSLQTITNNQSTSTNITDLNFSVGASGVRSVLVEYQIYRATAGTEFGETGEIRAVYNTLTTSWTITRTHIGNAGVDITVTNAGQFQYKSNDIGTQTFGKMRFRARTFLIA